METKDILEEQDKPEKFNIINDTIEYLKIKIIQQNKEILELKEKIKTIEWKINTILSNM